MKKNLKVQRDRPGSTKRSPLYTLSSGHPLTHRHLSTFLTDLVRLAGQFIQGNTVDMAFKSAVQPLPP